jgi:hypothetical protein
MIDQSLMLLADHLGGVFFRGNNIGDKVMERKLRFFLRPVKPCRLLTDFDSEWFMMGPDCPMARMSHIYGEFQPTQVLPDG